MDLERARLPDPHTGLYTLPTTSTSVSRTPRGQGRHASPSSRKGSNIVDESLNIDSVPVTTGFANSSGNWSNLHSRVANAQVEAHSQRRATKRSLVIGSLVIILLLGMIMALLVYLCLGHKCNKGKGRVLISTAPIGVVLTISQIASSVVPLTVAPVMSMYAYKLGASWIQSSTNSGPNRPSPLQLGLLMSICSSANFAALFRALKYVFRWGEDVKNQTLTTTPLIRRPVAFLSLLLTLSSSISAADAWFHASSKATTTTLAGSYGSDQPRNFGREINATMCNPALYDDNTASQLRRRTCGMLSGSSASGSTGAEAEGVRTFTNSSRINRVVYTDDQTAILVPQQIPQVTYRAESVGAKASCASITHQCVHDSDPPNGLWGPPGFPLLNCTGSPAFNTSTTDGILYANEDQLNDLGERIPGYEILSNPYHVGMVATSFSYEGNWREFVPNTGWLHWGNQAGYTNVVYCNVTMLTAIYTYSQSHYTIHSSSPVSLEDARHMLAFGSNARSVANTVEGAGIQTAATYEQVFQLELARQTLAAGAHLYRPKDVLEVQTEHLVTGSAVDLIPLTLLVGLALTYCCLVLFVLIQALTSAQVPYVHLASSHFTDPLVTVHKLYGPVDPVSTWQGKALGRFSIEGERDWLYVGVLEEVSREGEKVSTFGVRKGVARNLKGDKDGI